MSLFQHFIVIGILVCASAFMSMSEIAFAAARKIKLKLLAESGDIRAAKVLLLQEQPGNFFATTQVGLNAVAILGGILGEAAFRPYFINLVELVYTGSATQTAGFVLSFVFVTFIFVLFADLIPKRIAMIAPERVALRLINPINLFILVCKPLAVVINMLANVLFRLFKVNTTRDDNLTFDDISAIVDAGALSGVLQQQEHHFIENVFELESRTVPSSMTTRENVVFFSITESEDSIRKKISDYPHSKFLVCNDDIDHVIGYIDTKDILIRMLNNQSLLQLNETTIRSILTIPDSLTLSELLDRFRSTKEKLAVVFNEYALVVGIITLSDVMSTVMGDWGSLMQDEQQIVRRDDLSWLIDGGTPIEDLKRALELDSLPEEENYETAAGFIMFMLRKIPKRTDFVEFNGYKFEVVDIDHYKIDQLLVTQIIEASPAS